MFQSASAYFKKTGLGKIPQVLLNGIPLSEEDLGADSFEEAVVTHILHATPEIQKAIYNVRPNLLSFLTALVMVGEVWQFQFLYCTPRLGKVWYIEK